MNYKYYQWGNRSRVICQKEDCFIEVDYGFQVMIRRNPSLTWYSYVDDNLISISKESFERIYRAIQNRLKL